ncbi:hypothetical protein BH11BAC1_BH11BAC1_28030 [soil metagenome]
MNTLTWLFFAMSCIISGYTSSKITAWKYKRKIERLMKIVK